MTKNCRSLCAATTYLLLIPVFSDVSAQGQEIEALVVDYVEETVAVPSVHLDESFKPLSAISLSMDDEGSTPRDRFADVPDADAESVRHPMSYKWVAPGLAHNPLYTEDVALERYGWSYRPVVQPFASGVHFLKDVALLPYQAGLDCPSDVQCNLGYRRPGSCAPQVKKHLPWSWKGAALQAGTVVGVGALFP